MNSGHITESKSLIRTWKQETVGHIEINRPDKANAYNSALLQEFESVLNQIHTDKDVSTLVISGAGERSFCAGADLDEMKKKDHIDALNLNSAKIFADIASYPKVTIAAINGAAVAGGLELSLACDFRICSENAKFFFPETKLGLIPAAGGTQRLPKLVGIGKAKELIIGGKVWFAKDALHHGLVNEVVKFNELLPRAQEWGAEIGKRDQLALQLAKKAIDVGTFYSLKSDYETIAEALLYQVKNQKKDK